MASEDTYCVTGASNGLDVIKKLTVACARDPLVWVGVLGTVLAVGDRVCACTKWVCVRLQERRDGISKKDKETEELAQKIAEKLFSMGATQHKPGRPIAVNFMEHRDLELQPVLHHQGTTQSEEQRSGPKQRTVQQSRPKDQSRDRSRERERTASDETGERSANRVRDDSRRDEIPRHGDLGRSARREESPKRSDAARSRSAQRPVRS